MIIRNELGQFIRGTHYRNPQPFWNWEIMYDLYVAKEMSSHEIAEMYGVTDGNIIYWLRKHKIKRRTISEARDVKYWGKKGKDNPMSGKFGDLNPNYKGGITPSRQKVYSRQEWKSLSASVLKRADGFCERCGSLCKRPYIHHIIPIKEGGNIICEESKLAVLCSKCHGFVHSKRNTSNEFLEHKQ